MYCKYLTCTIIALLYAQYDILLFLDARFVLHASRKEPDVLFTDRSTHCSATEGHFTGKHSTKIEQRMTFRARWLHRDR